MNAIPRAALVLLTACLLGAAPAVGNPDAPLKALTVYPNPIVLSGLRAEQRLGVLGDFADGRQRDLTGQATFHIASAKIATAGAGGVLQPAADGETSLRGAGVDHLVVIDAAVGATHG